MTTEQKWSEIFRSWVVDLEESDPAHDLPHIERVVANSRKLALQEEANLRIVTPAAWLHDCVHVPKDSPKRSQASSFAADHAVSLLRDAGYPEEHLDAIHHAIAAHSFSANIPTESIEAMVLQDADRLDALGAFGLSRCLMLGGHMNSDLMSRDDPFCETREPDDARYVIDHFFNKLLKLEKTMKTAAGRALAKERTDVLRIFLDQLRRELPS